eukprot:gene30291-39512_t
MHLRENRGYCYTFGYGTSVVIPRTEHETIRSTIISSLSVDRFFPISCLLLPPVFLSACRSLRLLPTSLSSRSLLFIELATIYASLQAAFPASLAIFPQTIELQPEILGEKFRNLRYPSGAVCLFLDEEQTVAQAGMMLADAVHDVSVVQGVRPGSFLRNQQLTLGATPALRLL